MRVLYASLQSLLLLRLSFILLIDLPTHLYGFSFLSSFRIITIARTTAVKTRASSYYSTLRNHVASTSNHRRVRSQPARHRQRGDMTMKWRFSKGQGGTMREVGGIGEAGELYYVPSKRPSLVVPDKKKLGKEVMLPIFPRNQVMVPMGEDYLGIYEMKYRQMVNDVGEGGVFGYIYYSQERAKLALVGTLAKIKRIERLEDGGLYVQMVGVGRFYLKDIKTEQPYLKARVQVFSDWCEQEQQIAALEQQLLNEIRYSVKLMQALYPKNTYTINEAVLRNRPLLQNAATDVRKVDLPRKDDETTRRSKFSFANMDMLKTDPATKLVFLQEPVLENRYRKMIEVLLSSNTFLQSEMVKKGWSAEALTAFQKDALEDTSDLELTPKSSWLPKNFSDGDWRMEPMLMD